MRRLREECKLQFCVEKLLNDHSTASIVSFFNIRSLHRQIHDLRKDYSVLASDIIFVSESRLMARDDQESVFFYKDLHCIEVILKLSELGGQFMVWQCMLKTQSHAKWQI